MPNTETLYIPDTVTVASNYAFDGSYNMRIVVSDSNPVFSSKNGMLLDKEGKTLISWPAAQGAVRIPDGIETVGDYAFFHVYGRIAPGNYPAEKDITSVVFPESVHYIGNSAFCDRHYLKSISFENDDTAFGGCAFSGCYRLDMSLYRQIWKF